ncbi:MAG: hypothetical protein IJT30_05290 [Muribaculaceae bacterium]|nr:hypothetical protein [Muribaculaceae bacterium]
MDSSLKLNAEFFQNLGIVAQDENLLRRAMRYIKRLAAEKSDPTLMTKEEFFAQVDEALEEARQGKGRRFNDVKEMTVWLNSL